MRQSEQKPIRYREQLPVQAVVPQVAYRRAQVNSNGLMLADLLALQRQVGNRFVQDLVQREGPAPKAGWSDADPGTYPAPKDPSQLPTPKGGWNAGNQTIGGVERIPIEGLKAGLQASTARSPKEIEDEKLQETKESENGKAIAVVPTALKSGRPVEILLHLHGHNVGYRERSKLDKDNKMAEGSVRDVATDRIEQQIEASGRNMIGILPQGTHESGFGAFNATAYIDEVWGQLVAMKKLLPDAKRGPVVLSGHSGAAAPITQMLLKGNLPTGLGELVLFDAIHSGQRRSVEKFLETRMKDDVKKLKEINDPSLNGGLDSAAVTTQQTAYLAGSFRFRGIFTPKYHPRKMDDSNKPMWQDPETKKKPLFDEQVWKGYGVEYEPLRDFIKNWINSNTKGLASSLVKALRENYKVIPAGKGATHNSIMSANNNLQSALGALPGAAPAPVPKPAPAAPGAAPKTGATDDLEAEIGGARSKGLPLPEMNRRVQRLISAQTTNGQRIQRAPPAVGGGAAAGTATEATAAAPVPMDYSKMSQAELKTQYAVMQFMLMTSQFAPLTSFAPLLQQEVERIKQALIDKIVKEQLTSLLSQFQTIAVFIPGTSQSLPPGQMGPPSLKRVTFHAAYFINTELAKTTVKSARTTSHFGAIVKSGDDSGRTSLIESGGKKYGSGTAVRVGKATPENVRQFVQEALDNGTIRKYAVQKGKLAGDQQVSHLSDDGAKEVVQEWVIANGVGVDCSGFVLQAAVQARDAVRDELRGLGIPENKLPKEIGHEERRAKSFNQGKKVVKPSDLRPGDAWVLNDGGHVKIVIDVRQSKNEKGDPIIEFDTAESAGDSTHFATGPTQGMKQTRSLTKFGLGGSFHRI